MKGQSSAQLSVIYILTGTHQILKKTEELLLNANVCAYVFLGDILEQIRHLCRVSEFTLRGYEGINTKSLKMPSVISVST